MTERERFDDCVGAFIDAYDFNPERVSDELDAMREALRLYRIDLIDRASVGAEVEYGPGPVADMMSGLRAGVLPTPPSCAVCPTCKECGCMASPGNSIYANGWCHHCNNAAATPPPTDGRVDGYRVVIHGQFNAESCCVLTTHGEPLVAFETDAGSLAPLDGKAVSVTIQERVP